MHTNIVTMITTSLFYYCEKETSLPEKEDSYSHLNMEDISDADYAHAKRVCKDFEMKNLGEYHDLHAQSNTILLADIFYNFRNMCLKIHELDPASFLSAAESAWQAALKETKVKLDLLADVNMLLMIEKGIIGGICHSIFRYAKANNKYMKLYVKICNIHKIYVRYPFCSFLSIFANFCNFFFYWNCKGYVVFSVFS